MSNYFFLRFIVLLLLFSTAVANSADTSLIPCFPKKFFVLGNLGFTDAIESNNEKHGAPLSVGKYSSEGDGGLYTGQVLVFENLEIYINETRGIERISTTSQKIILAPGINVGMTLNEISSHLFFNALGSPKKIIFSVCEFDFDIAQELILHFSSKGGVEPTDLVLSKIEILQYGP